MPPVPGFTRLGPLGWNGINAGSILGIGFLICASTRRFVRDAIFIPSLLSFSARDKIGTFFLRFFVDIFLSYYKLSNFIFVCVTCTESSYTHAVNPPCKPAC